MQNLHLQNISFTDNDVKRISIGLETLTSLKSLSLSSEFMTDASVRTLVSVLNSESHRNFHSLYLSYSYIGRNKDDFLALAQLTGLQYLGVKPLKRLENIPEIFKVLTPLTQLKHLQFTMHPLSMKTLVNNDYNLYALLMEAIDHLVEAMNNLTGLQYLAFEDNHLLSIDIPLLLHDANTCPPGGIKAHSKVFPLNIVV